MREILFHGKRKDNGEWIEGFYHYRDYVFNGEDVRKHYILPINAQDAVEIVPNTAGQFICMTDKDGSRIWEGDFVKIEVLYGEGYNSRSVTGVISYDDLGFLGVIIEYCDGHPVWSDIICELELSGAIEDHSFEVIGNIYDNPELLKEVDANL